MSIGWLGGSALTGVLAAGLLVAACGSEGSKAHGGSAGEGGQGSPAGHEAGAGGDGGADAAPNEGGVGAASGAPSAGAAGGSGGAAGAGGEGEGGSGGWTVGSLDLRYDWVFPRKVERARPGSGWLVLLERTQLLSEYWAPGRELAWLDAAGQVVRAHGSTADSAVLDFAQHPSGELTVLVSTTEHYALRRFDERGNFLGETALEDPFIDQDPPALPPGTVTPAIEQGSRDAARLATLGEDVVVATRTGRHSVVAYRFGFEAGAFTQRWRALVVPGHSLYPVGLTGGSYDTFGQLEAQYVPHVAVSDSGVVFLATQHPLAGGDSHIRAHAKVFGEQLVGDADHADLYVTRLSSTGARLGTSVVGTSEIDELYGLRAVGETAYLVGRTEHWNEQGTGFDALVGIVSATDGSVTTRELDVELSDLAFDAYPLAGGGLLVAGVSGYAQNPHGASVTEASHAFVVRLGADGSRESVELPSSARHDEARAAMLLEGDRLLVAGMLGGPGTHSADGDQSLIRANGFLELLEKGGALELGKVARGAGTSIP